MALDHVLWEGHDGPSSLVAQLDAGLHGHITHGDGCTAPLLAVPGKLGNLWLLGPKKQLGMRQHAGANLLCTCNLYIYIYIYIYMPTAGMCFSLKEAMLVTLFLRGSASLAATTFVPSGLCGLAANSGSVVWPTWKNGTAKP